MSSTAHLNLARKWRSQQFDQIIGQDLSLRMLKNSLYLQNFFPVYLFSGQRGCGKTTTARVFASAINCEHYEAFQKDPKKYVIPCLVCASCRAMLASKHPDFIEMDAASHTGVDNVRQIIDAASLMPIMGRKKIYLIDEAHMLSKAAFNAFLKILEEPPASVIFILATTDAEKIIETVRSRCFQLFFKAIDTSVLVKHLSHVCEQEQISFEESGLELIVKETDGSARDALNLLESVRFSSGRVTKKAVLSVLGHVDDVCIITLLQAVLQKDSVLLLKTLRQVAQTQSDAVFLWRSFLQLLHACIWLKHGIEPQAFVQQTDVIKKIIERVHWKHIYHILNSCYTNEPVFLKTNNQHAFIEMVLLQMLATGGSAGNTNEGEFGSGFSSGAVLSVATDGGSSAEEEFEQDNDQHEEASHFVRAWQSVLRDISAGDDQMLASIFKQSVCKQFVEKTGQLEVEFCKKFIFFQDAIEEKKHIWTKVLQKHFGDHVIFNPRFTGQDVEPVKAVPVVLERVPQRPEQKASVSYQQKNSYPKQQKYEGYRTNQPSLHGPVLNIAQKDMWPVTHLVLQHFNGTVHTIAESSLHD
jgi:DNA polymerase-3 subunit gamma/tau